MGLYAGERLPGAGNHMVDCPDIPLSVEDDREDDEDEKRLETVEKLKGGGGVNRKSH